MKWQHIFQLLGRFALMLGEHFARFTGLAKWNLMRDRRFVDDSFSFALTWNYWFNDAVSVASDLVLHGPFIGFYRSNN